MRNLLPENQLNYSLDQLTYGEHKNFSGFYPRKFELTSQYTYTYTLEWERIQLHRGYTALRGNAKVDMGKGMVLTLPIDITAPEGEMDSLERTELVCVLRHVNIDSIFIDDRHLSDDGLSGWSAIKEAVIARQKYMLEEDALKIDGVGGATMPFTRMGDDGFIHYAFPGGYDVVYYDDSNNAYCAKCANEVLNDLVNWWIWGKPNEIATGSMLIEVAEEEFRCDCGFTITKEGD